MPADEVEHRKALVVGYDRLAVDQAGACRQRRDCRDDLREAVREVIAFPGEQPHAAVSTARYDAESVVLDLVNPASPCGRLLGRTGKTLDECSRVRQRMLTQHGRLINQYSARVQSGPPQQLRQLGDIDGDAPGKSRKSLGRPRSRLKCCS